MTQEPVKGGHGDRLLCNLGIFQCLPVDGLFAPHLNKETHDGVLSLDDLVVSSTSVL